MKRPLRSIPPLVALVVTGAAGVLPALAADQTVFVRDFFFTPRTVAVKPGEKVTFTHDGNFSHGVKFDDQATALQDGGTGWTVSRTWDVADLRDAPYTYHCPIHPTMTGSVYVNTTGTVPSPTPTPTPSTTPTPTPSTTPTPTPSSGGGSQSPATTQSGSSVPVLRSLRLVRTVVCAKRSARCRRPGVVLEIDLSAPADVRGTLRRRAPGARKFKLFGTVRFDDVAAGRRRLKFTRTASGRRLAPGRYRLRVKTAGVTRTLAFRVKG